MPARQQSLYLAGFDRQCKAELIQMFLTHTSVMKTVSMQEIIEEVSYTIM